MLTRKQVISVVKDMPETFETTHLFDRILLLKKIEEGRTEIREGKGLSTIQAKRKLKRWVK